MNRKYCAQDERLDGFGYCQKYNCFERSGEKSVLDNLISDAKKLWHTEDQWMSVSGPVSNSYSKNHRVADDIKYKATYRFGFVPFELTDAIFKFRHKKWDRNIRW